MDERLAEFLREFRVGSAELDAADVEPDLVAACHGEAERYRRGARRARAPRRQRARGLRRGGRVGAGRARRLDRHPCGPAARRHPRGAGSCSSTPACAPTAGASAPPRGIWLPECAYEPGLEHLLAEFGFEHFCTDQSASEPAGSGAAADRHRRARSPSRSTGRRSSGCGRWRATPPIRCYADFHRKSLRGCRALVDRRRGLRPRGRRAARAREQARAVRGGRGGAARAPTARRAGSPRPARRSRSTPSCSATGGGRARSGSRRRWRRCPRPGSGR